MSSPPQRAVILTCHPETPSAVVRSVEAHVRKLPHGMLAVAFRVEGDIDRLRVPEPRSPRRADRLWEHTCCEIFVSSMLPAYAEVNLSPSGEWAAYAFSRYRERAEEPADLHPQITVRRSDMTLELDASVALDVLPCVASQKEISLALSAVVEDAQGMLSYWALEHPGSKPDFHHPQAFALKLDEVRN